MSWCLMHLEYLLGGGNPEAPFLRGSVVMAGLLGLGVECRAPEAVLARTPTDWGLAY